jgi:DNA-binding beta-propeller fold protein YncE
MATKLSPVAPFTAAVAVTKSDVTVIPATRGIYVGGAGNVVVRFKDDTAAVTLTAVPVGTTLDISVEQVLDATSATLLVALY